MCSLNSPARHAAGPLWLGSERLARRLAVVGPAGTGEVVEPLPFLELGPEIDVALVAEKLSDLLLVGSVRALDLPLSQGELGLM